MKGKRKRKKKESRCYAGRYLFNKAKNIMFLSGKILVSFFLFSYSGWFSWSHVGSMVAMPMPGAAAVPKFSACSEQRKMSPARRGRMRNQLLLNTQGVS